MGDEVKPKPFAEVRRRDKHAVSFALFVGDVFVEDEYRQSRENLQTTADRINAAVEQREARLVAVLRRVEWRGAGVDEPYTCCPVCLVENEFHPSNQKPHHPDCALAAALAGKGDYVPRAELEAERERTRGVWALLADELNTGGLASERARGMMKAIGVEPAPVGRVEALTALNHSGPPCPKGCGSLGTPSRVTEQGRWHGPQDSTLWCPACGAGWVGTAADVRLAEVAWRAYEVLQDMGKA